ncbi:MAG TPA: TrmH family RNA methyltransferase [Pseudomonas xinjiangensis]|uniref:TrmH family RNA methyltransferase n=2 Tax=root TaxID=1 RepID=A0A7V1BKQ1_9GAMM|nr:TrmH family RNA methyltransferase [Halopseudomonas xinjiangensis]HEC48308.1 TrmH family RNA methyltransferase [Halopseudomonas xinjiangensis]
MPATSVSIGLIDPKSPSNVGAVMRAAGCYQVDAVLYTGSRYDRAARFHTDTKSARLRIPLTNVTCLLDALPDTTQIVCVELVEGAIALPAFEHPDQVLYVFGPEDGSLDQALVDRADAVVYIPTVGCMNLAATVNVVLYDRLAKSGAAAGSDELIRHSRDTNNRVTTPSRSDGSFRATKS